MNDTTAHPTPDPDPAAVDRDGLLGCGTDPDDLWDTIDEPATTHQRQCPHCTAARARLRPLAEATRQYRHAEQNSPDREPDPALMGRILSIARTEARRGRRLPLQPVPDTTDPSGPGRGGPGAGGGDRLSVSEQAVATVARRAADRVPGVQVRRCSVTLEPPPQPAGAAAAAPTPPPPAAASAPAETVVGLSLRLSIASTVAVPQLQGPLRAAVATAVNQEVGMSVSHINLVVEDLHDA